MVLDRQKQNASERKLTMNIQTTLKAVFFFITSSQIIVCSQFKDGSYTVLSNNAQQCLKLNNTFNYFKKNIIKTTQSQFNDSNLLDEMLDNPKAPKFNDIKNKQERWQQNVFVNSANERHMQDIIEYVQNSMIKQSNIELKTLLSDSRYDFLLLLEVGKKCVPTLIYHNQHELNHAKYEQENQRYEYFIGRVKLIQELVQKQPKLLCYKETFDFKERFLWPKWPLFVYRYFFKPSVCNDAMFSEFIRVCYDCDREENSNWPSRLQCGILKSFSAFYQEAESTSNDQYLNGHTPNINIPLQDIKIQHVQSVIQFFNNSPFHVLERLIRANYTIDFIACLNRLSRFYDLQQTDLEKTVAKDDFSKIEEPWNTMVQNVQIVHDCVYIEHDINKYLFKKASQDRQLFFTCLTTLFLLYYGSKKLYPYVK